MPTPHSLPLRAALAKGEVALKVVSANLSARAGLPGAVSESAHLQPSPANGLPHDTFGESVYEVAEYLHAGSLPQHIPEYVARNLAQPWEVR